MTDLLKAVGISFFAAIFLGCAETRHETLSGLGFTRPYLDGYQDGCFSRKNEPATHLEGFRQDPERMEADNKYAYGWNDGYDQCYADNKDYL